MKKIPVFALAALAVVGPHLKAAAADTFWVPLYDGQTLSFMQSGRIENSDGSSGTWGPERNDYLIQAVNITILDHHADWRMVSLTPDRYSGTYLSETAAGLFEVSRGDAGADAYYRYYIDPQPWIYLKQPFEVGQSVAFSGLRRGQYGVGPGGANTWAGTWSTTYKHLGSEMISTPLGTFDALKLERRSLDTTDTIALNPVARGRASWNEWLWFVPGLGIVKMQGSGLNEDDYNGDGIFEVWQWEEQTMVAVPEPATTWSLLAGLALLALIMRRSQPL